MKNRDPQECYARSYQEIEELKRRCCWRRKWSNCTKVEWIFHPAWSGIPSSQSILLWSSSVILIYWAVIDVSYPRKLSCEVGILRNTREEMSISENFYWMSMLDEIFELYEWFKNSWRHYYWFGEQKEWECAARGCADGAEVLACSAAKAFARRDLDELWGMIQEIWRHLRLLIQENKRNWEKWERTNHCNQPLNLTFQ